MSNFLLKELLGCGNYDLERALEIAREVGISEKEIAEEIKEVLRFSAIVDPVEIVYRLALEKVALENKLNLSSKISVYGNFLDTSYHVEEPLSKEEIEKLKENPSPATEFLLKELNL